MAAEKDVKALLNLNEKSKHNNSMSLMRNPFARHVDFSFLCGVIESNPKAIPSNIDGIMERRGRFLVLEWKHRGEETKDGQRMCLQALAWLERFTVVVVYGDGPNGTVEDYYKVVPGKNCVKIGSGMEQFKQFYRGWYNNVEAHK